MATMSFFWSFFPGSVLVIPRPRGKEELLLRLLKVTQKIWGWGKRKRLLRRRSRALGFKVTQVFCRGIEKGYKDGRRKVFPEKKKREKLARCGKKYGDSNMQGFFAWRQFLAANFNDDVAKLANFLNHRPRNVKKFMRKFLAISLKVSNQPPLEISQKQAEKASDSRRGSNVHGALHFLLFSIRVLKFNYACRFPRIQQVKMADFGSPSISGLWKKKWQHSTKALS